MHVTGLTQQLTDTSLAAASVSQTMAELDAIDDEQNTPLMLACIKGRTNIIKYLLAAGADLTLRGDDGMTCLHLAAQNGHSDVLQVLIHARADVNLTDTGGGVTGVHRQCRDLVRRELLDPILHHAVQETPSYGLAHTILYCLF